MTFTPRMVIKADVIAIPSEQDKFMEPDIEHMRRVCNPEDGEEGAQDLRDRIENLECAVSYLIVALIPDQVGVVYNAERIKNRYALSVLAERMVTKEELNSILELCRAIRAKHTIRNG